MKVPAVFFTRSLAKLLIGLVVLSIAAVSRLYGEERPNILLILADDLGYGDVGFNGSEDIVTPELDRLAKEGTVFSSAYAVHPFCGPSRMALLTGRYPHAIGVPYNLPSYSSGRHRDKGVPTAEVLLSSVLKNAGYATGLMGKWHLGHAPEFHPNQRGFDEFYGFLGGGILYFGPYQAQNEEGTVWDYRVYPEYNGVSDKTLGKDDYMTDILSDKGVEFIRKQSKSDAPFFLFMSYNAPHTLLAAKQDDLDRFPALEGKRKIYAAMVYALDRGVGRLVDALEETKELENTLIVFFSDNGGRLDQGASNGELRGAKGDVQEGGFRTPMFMHWPEGIERRQIIDTPVSALDLFPSFARIANAELAENEILDGVDILPLLRGEPSEADDRAIFAARHRMVHTEVSGRNDRWKLIWESEEGPWRLYDLETDISEQHDLSDVYPAQVSALLDDIGSWLSEHIEPLWFYSEEEAEAWAREDMPKYEEMLSGDSDASEVAH
ncbi:sulfatase-like hydrolase/transferase [Pelagicoccus sp. SDUM812005]|uniref:sulfatase-like hydrolase/transferase n=1 Tax=Pelagicoccus sp. SDUM812005 TaxID=3041257 RepID=UPI0028107835|nr:sulfatase-like hydrolase/transferase [Pelagicoccus sp. SDUM812005]MDQ8180309.1 sulfatase-like hydrolase/transferase [Pelagicoccus sp. SDUM812005]